MLLLGMERNACHRNTLVILRGGHISSEENLTKNIASRRRQRNIDTEIEKNKI